MDEWYTLEHYLLTKVEPTPVVATDEGAPVLLVAADTVPSVPA